MCKFRQCVFEQQVRLDKYYMDALVFIWKYNFIFKVFVLKRKKVTNLVFNRPEKTSKIQNLLLFKMLPMPMKYRILLLGNTLLKMAGGDIYITYYFLFNDILHYIQLIDTSNSKVGKNSWQIDLS